MNAKILKIQRNILMLKNFEKFLKQNKFNSVFVCVGNSDVWYDSFGPIVGTLLKDRYNIPCFVYGNIYNNIKLSNLNNFIKWIQIKHFDKKIIVIDAALSENSYNGIIFKEGPTRCAYYNKNSLEIGDYSILCPVKECEVNQNFNYDNTINNSLILSNIINKIYS